eukprot:364514-Chlamydomonas_euryale.AAC.5
MHRCGAGCAAACRWHWRPLRPWSMRCHGTSSSRLLSINGSAARVRPSSSRSRIPLPPPSPMDMLDDSGRTSRSCGRDGSAAAGIYITTVAGATGLSRGARAQAHQPALGQRMDKV